MKKMAIAALVIGIMASCNRNSDTELNKNTSQKTEIMEKDQILAAVKEDVVHSDDGWGDIV